MILTVTLNTAIDKRYVMKSLRPGEVNRVSQCFYTPGGKGLNVSRAVNISGMDIVATGFVGGYAGDYIVERLKQFGIKTDFYRLEEESRSCINIWDEEKQQQTELLEPGFTVSPESYRRFADKFRTLVKQADVVALSGSAPQGLDVTVYKELISIVKAEHKKVILDTSGAYLVQGMEAKPSLIKPNIDEIRMLTGKSCDTREELLEAAKQLHNSGIETVVISLGADGSLVVCDEGVFQAVVPKIHAVNATGCGDSMVAGFAMGLDQGLSMEETLRSASAISASAALSVETGFFAMSDMEQLLPQIKIIKLK